MKDNITARKSIELIRIVNLRKMRSAAKKEYILSGQLMRSGTASGALMREPEHAESKRDFFHKMSIALKEADETDYRLLLLFDAKYLDEKECADLRIRCVELIRLLASIVITTKSDL